MNRDQIERAERIAERLAEHTPSKRRKALEKAIEQVELIVAARGYKKPGSLRRDRKIDPPEVEPEFTDAQLEIAIRSLERQGKI